MLTREGDGPAKLVYDGVGVSRGGKSILQDVSFSVESASVYCVLGHSGAGKSTLLRLACRLEDPWEGRILLDGEDVRALDVVSLRRRVGLLFQEPVLFGETVLENLEFAAHPNADGPALDRPGRYLEMVGLDAAMLDRDPATLSAGQRQRVALARALVPEPEVLLLDEPTSALDPTAASGILRLVGDLRDRLSLTVVLVTHIVEQARRVADRVLLLSEGRVLERGGREVFDAPRRPETASFLAGESV